MHEVLFNYESPQDAVQDPTKFATHSLLCPKVDLISNCGDDFMRTVSFDNIG